MVVHILTLALGRQRQVDFYGFETSLFYRVSYTEKLCLKKQKNKTNKQTKNKKEKKRKGRKEGRKKKRKNKRKDKKRYSKKDTPRERQ